MVYCILLFSQFCYCSWVYQVQTFYILNKTLLTGKFLDIPKTPPVLISFRYDLAFNDTMSFLITLCDKKWEIREQLPPLVRPLIPFQERITCRKCNRARDSCWKDIKIIFIVIEPRCRIRVRKARFDMMLPADKFCHLSLWCDSII